ncbi:MAG: hypothetical protein PHO30_00385 [Candidatus Omnitrophica bacterium]|nr:hypothetical protein [Candidatus Omnitrophota bacterium]
MFYQLRKLFREKFKKDAAFLFLLFILSIVPFVKNGTQGVLIPPDAGGGLDMVKRLHSYSFTWNELDGTGGADTTAWYTPPFISHLPLAVPFVFFPLETAQRLMFILILFFQGVSAYFFVAHFFKAENNRTAAFAAAVFYMFNPWFMGNWWTGNFLFNYGSIFMPLALGAFIHGLNDRENLGRNIFVFVFVCTFMVTPHVQFFLLQLYPLIFYFFYHLMRKRNSADFFHALRFVFFAAAGFVLLNLFWIIPALGTLKQNSAYLKVLNPLGGFRDSLSSIRLLEYVRLLGMGIYNESFDGFYSSGVGCLISFLMVVIAFSVSVLKLKRKDPAWVDETFFVLYAFIFTMIPVLIAGNMAVQDIYVKLINIPVAGIIFFPRSLRFPQLAALAYAYLIGVFVFFVATKIKKEDKTRKALFLTLMTVMLLANAGPFVFGDLGGHLSPVQVPSDYEKSEVWLKSQAQDFKLFITPPAGDCGNLKYTWAKNIVRHVDFTPAFFLRRPFIQNVPSTGLDCGIIVIADSALNGSPCASAILSILNIKYIVHREDVVPCEEAIMDFNPVDTTIKCAQSFGKLSFYAIPEQNFVPHIYPSVFPVNVDSDGEMATFLCCKDLFLSPMPVFLRRENFKEKSGEVLMNSGRDTETLSDTAIPHLAFRKINPAKFEVHVSNARHPFWLVFSEGFHELWKVYGTRSALTGPSDKVVAEFPRLRVTELSHSHEFIPHDVRFIFETPLPVHHEIVNGYANGWYIDPNVLGRGDDFTLILYFYPQSLFYCGLIVSLAVMLLWACVLGYNHYKRRKHAASKSI